MRLETWLEQNDVSAAELARHIGYPSPHIYSYLRGERSASPRLVGAIYQATKGQVTHQDLSPELYEGIAPLSRAGTTQAARARR